jgi:hypothetical protein
MRTFPMQLSGVDGFIGVSLAAHGMSADEGI